MQERGIESSGSSGGNAARATPGRQRGLTGPQSLHADCPVLSWYVRAGQSVHSILLFAAANVPGKQYEGCVEPVKQNAPAGHGIQSPCDEMFVNEEKLPASHGTPEDDPSGQ